MAVTSANIQNMYQTALIYFVAVIFKKELKHVPEFTPVQLEEGLIDPHSDFIAILTIGLLKHLTYVEFLILI
jgi:hypothetical protein